MYIKLHGSCVSRDMFNYDDKEVLKLTAYSARSSLATLGSENIIKSIPNRYFEKLNTLESNLQKRMIEFDFNNRFIKSLDHGKCDVILIDLIDERFHLAQIGGKLVTRSVEFKKTGIKPDRIIDTYSNEFLELWMQGVENLLNRIERTYSLNVIKINKVFWAEKSISPMYTNQLHEESDIIRNNDKLKLMYEYLESKLPKSSILEVSRDLLVASPDNKWGLAPFHYIDDYYLELLSMLQGK